MISKRSIFILLMAFVVAMQTHAQDKRPKFSPEKFKADMEQFIVKEACLTPEESAKFFPVYDEMQKKQRAVFVAVLVLAVVVIVLVVALAMGLLGS